MGEVWRQCLGWLRSWSMVPPGVEVAAPEELVLLLRDGVVLCQLVHCLEPASVDMTQVIYTHHALTEREAVSDFVCRNNIFLFLHAAIKNFGLDHEHFFQPSDLYEATDISMVLTTLSFLSHSPKFTASGRPGFPRKAAKLERKMAAEEPLYEGLGARVAASRTQEPLYSPRRAAGPGPGLASPPAVERDEELYNAVCSPRRGRQLRPSLSFSKKNKREHPIREMQESEEKYLGNLYMVRDNFQLQLQHLSPEAMKIVFFKLQDLIVLHSGLLRALKEQGVGGAVLASSQGFRVYLAFCTNLTAAMARLEAETDASPKLRKELVQCQLAAKSPFPLSAHMVLPFQRLLKYHLLLKEILKHTAEEHAEHSELSQAYTHMRDFCAEVNETKREQEEDEQQEEQDGKDLAILSNLQRTIKSMRLEAGARLQDFGRLRRAGELAVEGENTDYGFLLDTVLLACNKPRLMQQRYRFKFSIKLTDYDVDSQFSSKDSIRLVPRLPSLAPLLLVPRSPGELNLWLHALLTGLDTLRPSENQRSGHQPVLACLAGGPPCSHCLRPFPGCLGQGYRCRACPALLHKACLAEQVCREDGVAMRRAGSLSLPRFLDRDSSHRSSVGSTLSLAALSTRGSPRHSQQVEELQREARQEQESLPVEQQDWWAGQIDLRTATDRIKSLPTGTFLVRGSLQDGVLALDLKARTSVMHMKISVEPAGGGAPAQYSFSEARQFPSLTQLVGCYRWERDLLENFSYRELEGVRLATPYQAA